MWEILLQYKVYLFIALGLLIPLLGYAVYLQWTQLKDIKDEREQRKKQFLDQYHEKQNDLKESLRIISLAAIQGQCELSEASLRMANLIPKYDALDENHQDFKAVFDLYSDIKELKYLEERNNMNINDRFAEDKIRFAAEEKHKDEMTKACERIYERTRA